MTGFPYFRFVAMSSLIALASCVGPSAPPPPAPSLPPIPVPAPPPLSADWRDWPVTPGDWSYRKSTDGSTSSFGMPGSAPLLSLRCEPAKRQIVISRVVDLPAAQSAGQMTLRTSFAAVQWPVAITPAGSATTAYVNATRAANDAALDQMAFSRGRFAIEFPGSAPLVVPNWAEVARIIEDCRS
jgi:hypothetical protein